LKQQLEKLDSKCLENVAYLPVDIINLVKYQEEQKWKKAVQNNKNLKEKVQVPPIPAKTTAPESLKLFLGLDEIPLKEIKVNTTHRRSQLITKRGHIYLQQFVWDEIRKGGNYQYILLAKNQYAIESILIIGDKIYFFQMKMKQDPTKQFNTTEAMKKLKSIVPILKDMGFHNLANVKFVFVSNSTNFDIEKSADGVDIISINGHQLRKITNLNSSNK